MLEKDQEKPISCHDADRLSADRLSLSSAATKVEGSNIHLVDVNPLIRYTLLVLNLVLWLAGVALVLVAGILLLSSLETREDVEVLTHSDLSGLLMSHLELTLLCAGLVLSAVSYCGCVGALRENSFLLRAYSLTLIALILANTLFGTLVIFMPASVKRAIQSTLSATLVVHYRDSLDGQKFVDAVQSYLGCCGMTSRNFRDWNDNIYFNCSSDNLSYERCSVPHSCCKRNASLLQERTAASLHCGRGVLNMSDYEAWFHINWNNCADTALRLLDKHVLALSGGCLALCIFFAFLDALSHTVVAEIRAIRSYYLQQQECLDP